MRDYDPITEYLIYTEKTGMRRNLYKLVQKEFKIKSAIYPGSFIDIDPSLFIEDVTYIDNFKKSITFFENKNLLLDYLNKNKEYNKSVTLNFVFEDYIKVKDLNPVDLLISQYAGFVGQATKQFLKTGGILLCNDSHGDATLAHLDKDYKLIATINNSIIDYNNLDEYFILSKNREIDINFVRNKMKGLKYKKNPQNYIFKKIN